MSYWSSDVCSSDLTKAEYRAMHGARSGSESMKLGICSMWGPSLQSFREEVKLASDLGYDLVTIGDSPAGWHELYVSMTLAALDAPTATIAPLEIGRASCRERVCQYVSISVVAVSLK